MEGAWGAFPCPFGIRNAADKAGCGPRGLVGEVLPACSGAARAFFFFLNLVLLFSPPGQLAPRGKNPCEGEGEGGKKVKKEKKRNKSVGFNHPLLSLATGFRYHKHR